MKTQKGITLIALIITIIVMLILVGVSVSVALNTGLFKTAQGVATNTQIAKDEEAALANGTITVKVGEDKKTYGTINEYLSALKGEFKLVETPTYKLHFDNKVFLIDENTTWKDVILKDDNDIFTSGYYNAELGIIQDLTWNELYELGEEPDFIHSISDDDNCCLFALASGSTASLTDEWGKLGKPNDKIVDTAPDASLLWWFGPLFEQGSQQSVKLTADESYANALFIVKLELI